VPTASSQNSFERQGGVRKGLVRGVGKGATDRAMHHQLSGAGASSDAQPADPPLVARIASSAESP